MSKEHQVKDRYITALQNRIDILTAEVNEQARLNGMGSEREARLMAQVDELTAENAKLKKQLAEKQAEMAKLDFGCHCDLEPGQKPDACVMDSGDYADCIHAIKLHTEGKTKIHCQYWMAMKGEK